MRASICFCVLLIPAWAQQSGAPGLAQRAAGATAEAKGSISLDVAANDKSGNPIAGLQEQDFTIIDNKQPRKIAAFHAAGSAPEPVEVILLIDGINGAFSSVSTSLQELQIFLKRNAGSLPGPTTIIALGELGVSLAASSSKDANDLVAAMNKGREGRLVSPKDLLAYGMDGLQQVSLYTLDHFADYEETRPGRKLLIWISPGWPLLVTDDPDQGLNSKEQKALFGTIVGFSDKLRQGRVTLYQIDPSGLEDADRMDTSNYRQFEKGLKSAGQVQVGSLGLQILAEQSGGRVLNSSNDISGEISKCLLDAKTYYTISFDAPKGDGPNELHTIDVKVDKPGVTARTRMMYYAQP